MNIDRRVTDSGIHVVKVSGNLTLGRDSQQFEQAMNEVIDGGGRKVVLDLSDVPYVDSAGLGMLIASAGRLKKVGGDVRLAGVVNRVRLILKMTGVDSVLASDATAEESVRAMAAG